MFDPHVLEGKRILVTGGGGGLGKGIADRFATHGAQVHLWGRRLGVLEEVASQIGDRAHAQAVDVRDAAQVDAGVEAIWQGHGPLTGVVNGAAANFIAQTKELSPRAFEAVTSTVMNGSFFTTHSCGKRWIADGLPGSVVSLLTTWVWTGSAFVTPSAMAKAAVHAMTMSLAVEWAPHGIRVNAVAPGPFPTDYAWQVLSPTADSAVGATQAEQVPLGRFGEIDELANLLTFLLADGCDYITGATIPIDGAHHLAAPSTFADLARLTDEDWRGIRERAQAASEAAKAQRTV
jgi:NAD(P)-dependent dehydrogenase (short-subunit alcohol dehydrogenase family)